MANVTLRVDDETWAAVKAAAEREGKSANAYVAGVLTAVTDPASAEDDVRAGARAPAAGRPARGGARPRRSSARAAAAVACRRAPRGPRHAACRTTSSRAAGDRRLRRLVGARQALRRRARERRDPPARAPGPVRRQRRRTRRSPVRALAQGRARRARRRPTPGCSPPSSRSTGTAPADEAPRFPLVAASSALMADAARLCETHDAEGAATRCSSRRRSPSRRDEPVGIACYDQRLARAAEAEGLPVLTPG